MSDRPRRTTDIKDLIEKGRLQTEPIDCLPFDETDAERLQTFLKKHGFEVVKKKDVGGRTFLIEAKAKDGFKIEIYCGYLGESVDVTFVDLSPLYASVNSLMEKLTKSMERDVSLMKMGFIKSDRGHKTIGGEYGDEFRSTFEGATYTKPAATHNYECLKGELDELFKNLAMGRKIKKFKKSGV